MFLVTDETPSMKGKEEPFIAPLMDYSLFWYWMIIFTVLAIILLSIFFINKIKKPTVERTLSGAVATNSYITEMDKVYALVYNDVMDVKEGYQRVSLIIREFLEAKTNVPASNMTLDELNTSEAPPRVIATLSVIYPVVFGNAKINTRDEFNLFMNSSRQILDGWWN